MSKANSLLKNNDMNMQLIQKIGKKFMKKVPVIKAGNTVRIHQRIQEGGKERIQIFEGLVIAVNSGTGTDKTFTVRKMVGSIGVEKIFPLYSKNITKIQVTKSGDVRRSKLYYMRKRSGKSARLREKHLTETDVKMENFEEEVVEAPKEEEAAESTEAPVTEATEAPAESAEAPEVSETTETPEAPAAEETAVQSDAEEAQATEEDTKAEDEPPQKDPLPTATDPEEPKE